jgi:hypothetical protein
VNTEEMRGSPDSGLVTWATLCLGRSVLIALDSAASASVRVE